MKCQKEEYHCDPAFPQLFLNCGTVFLTGWLRAELYLVSFIVPNSSCCTYCIHFSSWKMPSNWSKRLREEMVTVQAAESCPGELRLLSACCIILLKWLKLNFSLTSNDKILCYWMRLGCCFAERLSTTTTNEIIPKPERRLCPCFTAEVPESQWMYFWPWFLCTSVAKCKTRMIRCKK